MVQRSSRARADRAVTTGARVAATLRENTGPNAHVTGASGTLMAKKLVLAGRLMPCGWRARVEKKSDSPWVKA